MEAQITVHIVGANRVFQTLEVVVDTGYTGWVSLPEEIVNDIGLNYVGMRAFKRVFTPHLAELVE